MVKHFNHCILSKTVLNKQPNDSEHYQWSSGPLICPSISLTLIYNLNNCGNLDLAVQRNVHLFQLQFTMSEKTRQFHQPGLQRLYTICAVLSWPFLPDPRKFGFSCTMIRIQILTII